MATIKRVSPLKPGLRGARNWATAQIRAAGYSRQGFWRLFIGFAVIIGSITLLALWLGGFFPDVQRKGNEFTKNRLMSLGFVVDQVDVMGEGVLREQDVLTAIGVKPGDYLFSVDLKNAQQRVENISWVESAIVRRLWPDRIVVQIIERKPFALWQNEGDVYLVDLSGEVIERTTFENYRDLPLIVGADAPVEYAQLQSLLAIYPEINQRVSTVVRHNTGRWDLIVDDGYMTIALPAEEPEAALQKLQLLQNQKKVLNRQISYIDLRLDDRITFRSGQMEPV